VDWFEYALTGDHGSTATAFLHRSADEVAKIARILGDNAAAESYQAVATGALHAWRAEFIDVDGRITPATQATLVRALAFGLVPDDLTAAVAEQLVGLIRAAGTHLGTGFLATPFLLPVLADSGHLHVAYELLLQRTPPSWLYMLDQGATTIWEDWDAMLPDGRVRSSLNHFSMGAVIGFLHRYVAGLQILSPGYQRFRVAPRPGGGVTSAGAFHDSPFGRIEVSWRLDGDEGKIEVSVPDSTEAELILPSGALQVLGPGAHSAVWAR
jgi:alpha-L-rhamnosidase